MGLIVDCSGSMTDRFRAARQAPEELYKQLKLYKQLNEEQESFLGD